MTNLTLMTARGAEQTTVNATNQTQLAAGDLDPTFGTGGKVTTVFPLNGSFTPDIGEALVVQPDGRIIVAGSAGVTGGGNGFALARYNLVS